MSAAVESQVALVAPKPRLLPIGRVHACPTQPRKLFKGIEDLSEDVKRRGLLQPIMVRPKGEDWEIIFGERRWRACKLAGVAEIPAIVREMGDAEVLETQIVEHNQREDVHVLEEAEAYETLHKVYKYDVETIALKVGRSLGTVYQRMRLLALCPMGRKLVYEDKLPSSIALFVARIPSTKLQEEALREIRRDKQNPMTARAASEYIRGRYMLRLVDAQFPTSDAELLPKAGSCAECPTRSGNQQELFPDLTKRDGDLCTDPKCFKDKGDAQWRRIVGGSVDLGRLVLTDDESKKVFAHGLLRHDSGYVDLDATCYRDAKTRKYRNLLPKDFGPVILARDDRGRHHELVEDGVSFRKAHAQYLPEDRHGAASTAESKKARQEKKLRRAAGLEAMDRCVTRIAWLETTTTKPALMKFWRLIALEFIASSFSELYGPLCAVYELAPKKGEEAAALRRYVAGLKRAADLQEFIVYAMGMRGTTSFSTSQHPIPDLCAVFGINWGKVLSDTKRSNKEKGQAT